jgi:uncharacterized repeat protein (TIGR03803 family)
MLSAQTFTKLHDFGGDEGQSPSAVLIRGNDGSLYGTTAGAVPTVGSTVFEITTGGVLTTLYRFCQQGGCTDGRLVVAPLIQANGGNFYGTAERGGADRGGTIFEITPGGALTTLVDFCYQAACRYGSEPNAGLVQSPNGKLFGTTTLGGLGTGTYGNGTVFSIIPGGTMVTTLYSFCVQSGCPDGSSPGKLVQAFNGLLYGTTFTGGRVSNGGTIFELTRSGALATIYKFCSTSECQDGKNPSLLFQASDEIFYGLTSYGGGTSNAGTVFKLTPGAMTTLHRFDGADGALPTGLMEASDGNLYGTTQIGGVQNAGTVFKITPGGDLTTLYSFCSETSCTDGQNPYAGLVQAADGNLYGTTAYGGTNGAGTVFKLSISSDPL